MGRGRPGEAYHVCSGTTDQFANSPISSSASRRPTSPSRPIRTSCVRSISKCSRATTPRSAPTQTGPPASRSSRHSRTSSSSGAERFFVSKRALITGITGQDGSYLAELLLEKDYEVLGMVRRPSTVNFERIAHLQDKITFVPGDLLDEISMIHILQQHRPQEVYNLAAQSFVQTSFGQPVLTGETTALGVTRLLDAIRLVDPEIRFYQASSSEMFGKVHEVPQKETTPFHPARPTASPRSTGTGSRSTTARATTFTPPAASSSTTRALARPGVRHPQDQPHGRSDQARPGRRTATRQPRSSATGASPATMSRPCG